MHLLDRYKLLAKRWTWLILLGVIFCGCTTFLVSMFIPPSYQASATLIVNLDSSPSSSDNITASELAVPTYAQLIATAAVLGPVAARHPGMTVQQLNAMLVVNPQSNTQLIVLDVQHNNPHLAMQLANEISQSFVQFAQGRLAGAITFVAATLPTRPIGPTALQKASLGAVAGLGFALALIVVFVYLEDLPTSAAEVQALLDVEPLATISQVPRKQEQRVQASEEPPAVIEGCHLLSTSLKSLQEAQAFKTLMITSAQAQEGKSTIAMKLASILAQSGKNVLLVDANLRQPTLHQHFLLDNQWGLANALSAPWLSFSHNLFGQATTIPTLRVLTAGTLSANAAELLESAWADKLFGYLQLAPFDFVIFDAPSLLAQADTQILASHVEALLMIVDVTHTSRRTLRRVKPVLDRVPTAIAGLVINKSPWVDTAIFNDDQYRHTAQQRQQALPPSLRPRIPNTGSQPEQLDALDKLDTAVGEKRER